MNSPDWQRRCPAACHHPRGCSERVACSTSSWDGSRALPSAGRCRRPACQRAPACAAAAAPSPTSLPPRLRPHPPPCCMFVHTVVSLHGHIVARPCRRRYTGRLPDASPEELLKMIRLADQYQVTRFMAAASSSFEALPLASITPGVMLQVCKHTRTVACLPSHKQPHVVRVGGCDTLTGNSIDLFLKQYRLVAQCVACRRERRAVPRGCRCGRVAQGVCASVQA